MTICRDGLVYLTSHQRFERHYDDKSKVNYSNMRILLMKLSSNNQIERFIKGEYSQKSQQLTISKTLQKGTYLVLVDFDWISPKNRHAVVSAYSAYRAILEDINPTKLGGLQSIYRNIGLTYLSSFPSKVEAIRVYDDSRINSFLVNVKMKYGMYMLQYVNDSESKLRVSVSLTLVGMKKCTGRRKFILKPKEKETIVIKTDFPLLQPSANYQHEFKFI